MFRFAGPHVSFGWFGCMVWCVVLPYTCTWCPMVAHADSGSPHDEPRLLRIQSAVVQQWMPPSRQFDSNITTSLRSGRMILTPEPYSYLLATFGVFGLLAMGTIFRNRKNRRRTPEENPSTRSRTAKYGKYRISMTGRTR